jgi:hypothetical protein
MELGVVSVDWSGYSVFDPGVRGPLHELARRDTRAAFNRLMAAREARVDALRQLTTVNGFELGTSDSSLQDLNDWFRREVEPDPANPCRLRPLLYSVVNDIGLFLGDVMIERCPGLRWEFFTAGKTNVAYQRHVLMGFTSAADARFNIDPDLLVAIYKHRIIAGLAVEDDAFCRWLKAAELRA